MAALRPGFGNSGAADMDRRPEGRRRILALPDGVVVSLIVRGREVVMPRGSSTLLPGDHVFLALRTALEP